MHKASIVETRISKESGMRSEVVDGCGVEVVDGCGVEVVDVRGIDGGTEGTEVVGGLGTEGTEVDEVGGDSRLRFVRGSCQVLLEPKGTSALW